MHRGRVLHSWRFAAHSLLLAAFALVAGACSVDVPAHVFDEALAAAQGVEFTVDPLTGAATDVAEGATTATATKTAEAAEPAADDPEPIRIDLSGRGAVPDRVLADRVYLAMTVPDGKSVTAPVDQFIREYFPDAVVDDLPDLQDAVNLHCRGWAEAEVILMTRPHSRYHDRIFAIDESTCTSIIVTGSLQAEPTGAATFTEAVATRFERTLWWGSLEDFENQADMVCADGDDWEQNFDLIEDEERKVTLSVSARAELGGIWTHGECFLDD